MTASLSSEQFATAWSDLRPTLLTHACRLVGANDAEDLAQETALVALNLLDRFDAAHGRTGLRNWLLAILTNLSHSYNHVIRAREITVAQPRAYGQQAETDACPSSTDTTFDSAFNTSLAAIDNRIAARLRGMRHRRREIWQLWRQGYTQPQIAAMMGLTQQVASYHITAILDDLRANAGDLIDPRRDGYRSAEHMFAEHARVTIYRRPQRRGTTITPR